MKVSTLKKAIRQDAMRLAEFVGITDAKLLVAMLSDVKGKFSSNMYIAYKLQALADVEEFMKSPAVKRKITLMKQKKQRGG
jgi:hypothetical protein